MSRQLIEQAAIRSFLSEKPPSVAGAPDDRHLSPPWKFIKKNGCWWHPYLELYFDLDDCEYYHPEQGFEEGLEHDAVMEQLCGPDIKNMLSVGIMELVGRTVYARVSREGGLGSVNELGS